MNKKITVLHMISHPGLGGAQSMVKDLVANTKNQYVYSLRKSKNNIFADLGNKAFYFDSYKYYKFNIKILFDLNKIIKKNKINILHLHLGKPLIYAYLIKMFNPRIIIIYHEHGLIVGSDKTNKQSRWYIWYLRLLQRKVNKFIMISKYVYNLYKNQIKISENKLELLYNFINLNNFHRLDSSIIKIERKKLNLNDSNFLVGFAGRLNERKGWNEFLLAAKEIIKKNKNFKFLIAGIGPDEKKMLTFIHKNKLSNNIIYLGFVKDMNWFYSILNCFCVPSHWEPMGLVQIEAQAVGIPIIVTKVPGLEETVSKNNCLFIKSNDFKDLSKKLLMLKNDKKMIKKLIKGGFKNVKNFSLNKYISNLEKIYSEASKWKNL